MLTSEQLSKLTKELNNQYCQILDLSDTLEKADIYIGRLESIIKEQEEWLRELLTKKVSKKRKAFILEQITPLAESTLKED